MNSKDKIVYVIGHRNPDTDSVASAAGYAALKQALGMKNCIAARAGKTTPQTEYIFSRFNAPLPEFLPDLTPKVEYYYNSHIHTIDQSTSLWDALTALQNSDTRALPVVDGDGCYHSLLHYSFFAQKLLQVSNPKQKTSILTSIDLLAQVLHAQVLVAHSSAEIKKSPVVVAAAEMDTFKQVLGVNIPGNTIVLCGNRVDIQRHAINAGVRALVVTNGNVIGRELREKAEEKGVSVIISPYDTSSTTLLLIYSMPVSVMANSELKALGVKDSVRRAAPLLSSAPGKSLPVVDDDNRVVGVLSETDLYHEANIEIIMVYHNEPSQAIE
ncbi:MAG: CBS domain-containing protein, partial [Planctomycetes bacterium]|nr:CBS domain-containing protein [Planctomycetota bacterium]